MHRWFELALKEVAHVDPGRAATLVEQVSARGFLDLHFGLRSSQDRSQPRTWGDYDIVEQIGKHVPDKPLLYPIRERYDPQPLEDFPFYSREQLFQFIDKCSAFHQDCWDLPPRRPMTVDDLARSLPEGYLYDLLFRQPSDSSYSHGRTPKDALGPARQLLVVPGFPLQGVPLAAAHDGNSFLIEKHAVALIPSGTWFSLRRPERSCVRSALVLADPHDNLPGARQEGALVAQQFRNAGIEVNHRSGNEVTCDWVLRHGRSFDVLHYAGHGGFCLQRASFSALSDGHLYLDDLCRERWNTRFAFVNACRTGERQVHLLEEALSMASGLLACGAGAVLGTIWPVDDATATRFASTFYSLLLAGNPVGEAYQGAIADLIQASVPPRGWARYLLIGDPRLRTR
jgi:hypothetical protein